MRDDKGDLKEEVKALLEEDEEILWSGKPDENALTEDYKYGRFGVLMGIFGFPLLVIFFIDMQFREYQLHHAFMIPLLIIYITCIIFIEIVLIFALKNMYKLRKFPGVYYCISSKRVFLKYLEIKKNTYFYYPRHGKRSQEWKYTTKSDGYELHGSYFEVDGTIAFININNIEKIRVENGHVGQNVTFTYFIRRDRTWEFRFAQIKIGFDELIEIIKNQLGFQQIESESEKIMNFERKNKLN